MNLDVVLPISLLAFILTIIIIYRKIEKKIKLLFEKEMKLRKRDVVLLVLLMGIMITVMALVPDQVLQIV